MSRPAMIPNNENYHGLQHEPANRDDLREWRRMDNAGSTRTEDSMKTDTGAGTDLVIHAEHGNALDFRAATDAAALCKEIVTATACTIQKRKYVKVEGWQAIAVAHGCVASSGDVERIEGGIRAIGTVRRGTDGVVIASAEGFLGDDEPVWSGGEATDRYGNMKTYPPRAEYAKRAMAQTRAISRACRSAFAHVVVMMNAGLETTPAEEIPEGGFDDEPKKAAPKATVQPPAATGEACVATGVLAQVSTKTGESKKGTWVKYGLKIDGEWYSTFDRKLGEAAESIQGETVTVEWEQDGKFKTAKTIAIIGDQPAATEKDLLDDLPYDDPKPNTDLDEKIPF